MKNIICNAPTLFNIEKYADERKLNSENNEEMYYPCAPQLFAQKIIIGITGYNRTGKSKLCEKIALDFIKNEANIYALDLQGVLTEHESICKYNFITLWDWDKVIKSVKDESKTHLVYLDDYRLLNPDEKLSDKMKMLLELYNKQHNISIVYSCHNSAHLIQELKTQTNILINLGENEPSE